MLEFLGFNLVSLSDIFRMFDWWVTHNKTIIYQRPPPTLPPTKKVKKWVLWFPKRFGLGRTSRILLVKMLAQKVLAKEWVLGWKLSKEDATRVIRSFPQKERYNYDQKYVIQMHYMIGGGWWRLWRVIGRWKVAPKRPIHQSIHPTLSHLIPIFLSTKTVWKGKMFFFAVLLLFSKPLEPWGRKKKRGKDICFIECVQCPPDFAALVIRLQDLPPWSLLTLLKGKSEHTAPINKPKQT